MMSLACVNADSKLTFPVLYHKLKNDVLCLLHLLGMKVLKSAIVFSSFWMALDNVKTRKKP